MTSQIKIECCTIQDKSGSEAENLIYMVLRQRHMKEAVHLEEQLAREKAAKLAAARAAIADQRAQDKDKLLNAFEQVCTSQHKNLEHIPYYEECSTGFTLKICSVWGCCAQ